MAEARMKARSQRRRGTAFERTRPAELGDPTLAPGQSASQQPRRKATMFEGLPPPRERARSASRVEVPERTRRGTAFVGARSILRRPGTGGRRNTAGVNAAAAASGARVARMGSSPPKCSHDRTVRFGHVELHEHKRVFYRKRSKVNLSMRLGARVHKETRELDEFETARAAEVRGAVAWAGGHDAVPKPPRPRRLASPLLASSLPRSLSVSLSIQHQIPRHGSSTAIAQTSS